MRDDIFRKTEAKLYDYFEKDMLISSYKNKIEYLSKCKKELEEKIVNTDIEINADIKAISYEEKVQTSGTGISYAEKMMIEMIDGLINEKCRVKKEILELEARIRRIESNNKIIECNITMLNKELKEFINHRYKEKKTNREIALKMNLSESGITRIKNKSIKRVDSWERTLFANNF